jgi:hypothetical protein
MAHVIAEAIIENGQLRYIDRKLPDGKIKAHIIYDTVEQKPNPKSKTNQLMKDTSGIYRTINAKVESRSLRKSWERDADK